MEFGKSNWRTFEQGTQKEWLLTNGIGGFASSTIIGANTRRYHGLLVASLNPPVKRHLILSKIDESIIIGNKSYNLYSSSTPDAVIPGYLHLQRFTLEPLPTFLYSIEDVFIEKKISMVYGENTTVIVYHVTNRGNNAKLKLTPLVNFRDYHQNSSRYHMRFDQRPYEKSVTMSPYKANPNINIYCSEGIYVKEHDSWFINMYYPGEQERGLHSTEDHYIPGFFEIEIKPWEEKDITIIATIDKEVTIDNGLSLVSAEEKRINNLIDMSGYKDDFARTLTRAADAFIVHRKSTNAKTIIAGYPWFTDWGRDTMIALPGLTLSTGRFKDAKDILYTFSRYVRDGLVPNMFPDEGSKPIYNTVDASLWYFEAVIKYIQYTSEYQFVKDNIFESLKEIISAYTEGTKYHIKMDDDYLVHAGEKGTQLTWMDAKVGDWVVTPRQGKAVEINALWYNALKVMAHLSRKYEEEYAYYEGMANNVKDSFSKKFWNSEKQCLFDVIAHDYKDDKVRPNQILAASLTYPVIEGEISRKVVDIVWKELYASYGLRSLSPKDDQYKGVYIGDQYKRDSAYHQGTVWAWPIGHFITAFLRAYGYTDSNRKLALRFIKPFRDHLQDACIGSISEIFDGNEPLVPRGCFAQAWSVGEVLRVYSEDILGNGINPPVHI